MPDGFYPRCATNYTVELHVVFSREGKDIRLL